jgi:hypothetical protein
MGFEFFLKGRRFPIGMNSLGSTAATVGREIR